MPNTGAPGQISNNFVFDPNKTQSSTTFDGRVDHRFSNYDFFYARFTSNNVSSVIPTSLPNVTINGVSINPGNGQFGFAGPAKDKAYNGQLNYTHAFNTHLLLELKAAYTESTTFRTPRTQAPTLPLQLVFPTTSTSAPWQVQVFP
jgi:hypothetical protein